MEVSKCYSLSEVRENIDNLDRQIVILLAKRGEYVKQAALFKTDSNAIEDKGRLEQVIKKVSSYAKEIDFDPLIIEKIYRNMIDIFIQLEFVTFDKLHK